MRQQGELSSGRVAQNQGRRDNIRAGSVSGPWRSAPKTDPEPPREEPVRRAQVQKDRKPNLPRRDETMAREQAEAAATGAFAKALRQVVDHSGPEPRAEARAKSAPPPPAPAPQSAATAPPPFREARPIEAAAREAPAPAEHKRRFTVAKGVVMGLVAAVLIVTGALFLRYGLSDGPDAASESIAAADEEAVAPARAGNDAAASEGADTASAADQAATGTSAAPVELLRVRLGPNHSQAAKDRIVAALEEAGLTDFVIEDIPFAIAVSRVGYYHGEDRAAADLLARKVTTALGSEEQTPIAVRDYGNLLPNAAAGRLDLWLKSSE